MKIFPALAVLFLLVCVLSTMGEAGRRRKGRGRKRKSGNSISVSPGSGCKCKAADKGKNCFNLKPRDVTVTGRHLKTKKSTDREEVETSLNSTRIHLEGLFVSLKNLTGRLSDDEDLYQLNRTAELILTESIQLTSDNKSKVLGQMTYWLTRIRASLRVLERLVNRARGKGALDLPPSVEDLNSIITDARKVQRSLNLLWSHVGGHSEKNTGNKKGPLQCQKVRVMKAKFKYTERRNRSFIVLRDALQAVDEMRKRLNSPECNVKGSRKEGFSLGCQLQSVFYPEFEIRVMEACDLHKWKCANPAKRSRYFYVKGTGEEVPGSTIWVYPLTQSEKQRRKKKKST